MTKVGVFVDFFVRRFTTYHVKYLDMSSLASPDRV
jgi:hypothetical protein